MVDSLIKGSCGTVVYLVLGRKPLLGTIFVKFDDPLAGNPIKIYDGELK